MFDVERSDPAEWARGPLIKRIFAAYEEMDLLYASGIPVPIERRPKDEAESEADVVPLKRSRSTTSAIDQLAQIAYADSRQVLGKPD